MYDMFLSLADSFRSVFFVRQLLVIIMLYMLGLLMLLALSKSPLRNNLLRKLIIAYPVGLSQFCIIASLLLCIGITYNTITVTIVLAVISGIYVYLIIKNESIKEMLTRDNRALLIIAAILVIISALVATSGLSPISISNDSMYYFHEYPRNIVYFGGLRDQFDSFLTDTGLGVVSIETLPFLYGFNESFGIREFMHMNFLVFIAFCVYEKSHSRTAAFIAAVLMMVSSPVYILGHWAMANMYFMELFFISALLMTSLYIGNPEDNKANGIKEMLPAAIITIAASLIRIEGGIFILLLIGCYTLLDVKGRYLNYCIIFPILALLAIYEARIFLLYKIDNPYTFLTPSKALIQLGAFLMIIIYIAFIRERLIKVSKKALMLLIVAALVGVNGLLFIYNRSLYMDNLRAFSGNFLGQSGWGMLPHLSIAAIVIVCAANLLVNKENGHKDLNANGFERHFFLVLTIGFMLVTIAVSFMRGDALLVAVGDSGNRVMLQASPLIIYTITLYFIRLNERFTENNN